MPIHPITAQYATRSARDPSLGVVQFITSLQRLATLDPGEGVASYSLQSEDSESGSEKINLSEIVNRRFRFDYIHVGAN